MIIMQQALLAPPLYLGRVAKRLEGPNTAKVDNCIKEAGMQNCLDITI